MSDWTTLDLGSAIDTLYDLRTKRLAEEKAIKLLKADELSLRIHIQQQLDKVGLDGAKGKEATAALIYETQPVPESWDDIYMYIETNDAFDLLQRRLSTTAVKERWDAGVVIPGIGKFDSVDLSLTKRTK